MITFNIIKYFNGSWKSIHQNRLSRNIIYNNGIIKSISTVDFRKIEHFSAIKDSWWGENCSVTCLHTYNPFRIQFVKDGLINAGVKIQNSHLPLKGIQIVEVGCGGGIMVEGLARMGAQVTGIDVSEELIDTAKEHLKLNPYISDRVNYIYTNVQNFAQKERQNSVYDAVIASEVLQYVTDPQLFLKECVKIVKPGKSIFITTINKTLTSWLSINVVAEQIFRCIPYGTFEWHKFITPHEVQHILKNYGCETRSIRGMKLNPMTKQWSWSSTLSNFYGLHAIKRTKISV